MDRTATAPLMPTTMRTTSGACPRGGMKSMTRTVPSGVTQSVCRINVPSTYWRVVQRPPAAGASFQHPASGVSSSAAKHAGESNRGKHNQSMEPALDTSAPVCRSPSRA